MPARPSAAQDEPPPTVAIREDPDLGQILVDPVGWTLYSFTQDPPGASACDDACAVTWPPLLAEGEVTPPPSLFGFLGLTTRLDGSQQVTYNDMPLYYSAGDVQPGDASGHGVGHVWFTVNPDRTADRRLPPGEPTPPLSVESPPPGPEAATAEPTEGAPTTSGTPTATSTPVPTARPTSPPSPTQPPPTSRPAPSPTRPPYGY